MTPKEHYEEAERLLRLGSTLSETGVRSQHQDLKPDEHFESKTDALLAALTHATLYAGRGRSV